MFDKLEDLLIRFEEIMGELNEPDVTANQERFRALMKEQSDLTPIVEAYREYKKCNQDIEDSLMMLDEENDPDMREMLKEELNSAKTRVSELEEELKILLLPKDPNDEKNVIVEIRAGAGGDEAALFAAEIYRMYVRYAERQRWRWFFPVRPYGAFFGSGGGERHARRVPLRRFVQSKFHRSAPQNIR